MNEQIIKFLTEYKEIYRYLGDVYREAAYTKAIPTIRRLQYKITSDNVSELSKLKNIGKSIREKIALYLTGDIKDLDELKKSPRVIAHEELGSIMGVGSKTVDKWIKLSITDIPKLKKAVGDGRVTLNNIQTEGLKYYSDLKTRIPRSEVKLISDVIEKIFWEIFNQVMSSMVLKKHKKPFAGNFAVAGSYRRGSSDSGDIDIIMATSTPLPSLLERMVLSLMKYHHFVSAINNGKELTIVLIKGPTGIVRQVDLFYVNIDSYPAALLHFTGSWELNEYMRGIAKSKGFRLNQHGLYKINNDKLINVKVKSEKEIFDIIGMKYLEPNQR